MKKLVFVSMSGVLFLASLLCSGCEDDFEGHSNKPSIEVEPTEIHFRTLNRGETEVEITKVKNIGQASLVIDEIRYEGDSEFTPPHVGRSGYYRYRVPYGYSPGVSVSIQGPLHSLLARYGRYFRR